MEENEEKIRIDRILGSSVTSNAHFDSDSNGLIAYPAGNTIVLLDTGSGTVVSHIVLETRKPISALQLKSNSLLFAASEESNFLRVINWQTGVVKDISPCQNVVCAAVSSVLGVLVTVGSDRVVSLWDFKGLTNSSNGNGPAAASTTPTGINPSKGRKLASSSVACKVSCVAFSPNGNYFVTGGTRHLKFWYLQLGKNECVLTGRPAILGSEHSNADFRDVITDGNATYAVANFDETVSATLCQFDERRFLDKWVQLKTKQAMCISIDGDLLFIGCAEGIIRCFRAGKLDFVATLPLPHHLGVDIAKATDITALSSHPPGSKFPNVLGICAPGGKKVIASYADHSFYAWDIQDIKRVGLSHSWLHHSGCIWDIALGCPTQAPGLLHWPSFITCSNDDTVRTWDITSQTKTNLYSNECLDVKYISTRYLDSPLFISHGNGVRCVGVGATFVCCGDRQGNFRLWRSKSTHELIKIKAHKEEILSIDVKGALVSTASRDGAVNLYLIDQHEVEQIASLQEHKGSVTSVKIVISDHRTSTPSLNLLSCGADKNLVLRQIMPKDCNNEEFDASSLMNGEYNGELQVQVCSVVASKTPLFDMETDSGGKHVLVACQDSCVRVYNMATGKHSKTLRSLNPDTAGLGTIIKLTIDPSGYYLAVASTDKSITVFDYYKGDVVASLLGHSELATALRFTPDFQNLISVGGDSCIFVWALSREMVVTMTARMGEKRSRKKSANSTPIESTTPTPALPLPISNPSSPDKPNYRFSFGQLPDWAKKQMKPEATGNPTPPMPPPKKSSITLPQGKWSERVEQASGAGALTIKSFYHADTVVQPPPFTKPQASKVITNVEKLSSLESHEDSSYGTENLSREKAGGSEMESLELPQRYKGVDGYDEESTDFYSGKSTDGETPVETARRPKPKPRSDRDTDSDGSSRQRRAQRRFPPYQHQSSKDQEPYEVVRSKNAELILSVKLKNKEMSKSRLELEKRLEETKKKLQSIGYKSMSQSTQDLSLRGTYTQVLSPVAPISTSSAVKSSHSQTKSQSTRPQSLFLMRIEGSAPSSCHCCHFGLTSCSASTKPYCKTTNNYCKGRYINLSEKSMKNMLKNYLEDSHEDSEDNGNSKIRRACSLSDLNNLNGLSSTPTTTTRRKRSFNRHRNDRNRNNSSGVFDPQNILTRSTSVSALTQDQSDSDAESMPSTPSYMSKTISSQGKLRRKPATVVSAYSQSQENLRDGSGGKLRVSASEQNLSKLGSLKVPTPMPRSKMNTPNMKKPQQVHGIARGMAVVMGVRQGCSSGDHEESSLNVVTASTCVEALKKSIDQVILLRHRVYYENIPDEAPISRILDEGLRSVQRTLQESSQYFQQETSNRPKIILQHEPTAL